MQPLESRPQAARILTFRKLKRICKLHLNRVPFASGSQRSWGDAWLRFRWTLTSREVLPCRVADFPGTTASGKMASMETKSYDRIFPIRDVPGPTGIHHPDAVEIRWPRRPLRTASS